MAKKLIGFVSIFIIFLLTSGCQADNPSVIDGYLVKKEGIFHTPYCAENDNEHCFLADVTQVVTLADVIGTGDQETDRKIIEHFKRINNLPNDSKIDMNTQFVPGNKYWLTLFNYT